MRVSLYAQITMKDRPKDYDGILDGNLSIGKEEPAELSYMIVGLIRRLGDFYSEFMTTAELNAELDRIADYCSVARFFQDES